MNKENLREFVEWLHEFEPETIDDQQMKRYTEIALNKFIEEKE